MRVVANSLYQSCPKGVGNNIAGYRNQVVLSSYRPIKEATLPSIVLDCSSLHARPTPNESVRSRRTVRRLNQNSRDTCFWWL